MSRGPAVGSWRSDSGIADGYKGGGGDRTCRYEGSVLLKMMSLQTFEVKMTKKICVQHMRNECLSAYANIIIRC